MSSKIIFGSDLIDVLENKYNMNKLGEVPTKYKNGITIIDFIYGKEKDIDDLKYNKPYVEFSIDDETDGFISGTMYLNGVESVQFDSWDDLKYFVKNAKWTESEKSMKKSLKESVEGYIATDEDCNMSGKGWVLDGSYNFTMGFLQEWGIAPKDVKVKNGMTTLYNADGKPFGYVYQDGEVDIFVADKTINWTWENHNPSTKLVKVTASDEIF